MNMKQFAINLSVEEKTFTLQSLRSLLLCVLCVKNGFAGEWGWNFNAEAAEGAEERRGF